MNKYFFTLLCTCLAIHAFADVPRLSRGDLRNATITADIVPNATSISDAKSSQSLQSFMREHQLTLNNNRLNNRSPQLQSIEELQGVRIASVEAYDFDWDDDSQIAVVKDSDCVMMGRYCCITYSSGQFYLSDFYCNDHFKIPLEINTLSDSVTIKAGQALAYYNVKDGMEILPMLSFNAVKSEGIDALWTLYAMPLSWLTGDDECDDIHGHVEADGSIMFDDDFAFLVKSETEDGNLLGWRLSPIFKNLILLKPNGEHTFTVVRPSNNNDGPHGHGIGGLVPRKPGKPVNPRPISSIIEGRNPKSGSDRSIKDVGNVLPDKLMHVDEVQQISDRYIDPGDLIPGGWSMQGKQVPVYMYMPDDTTLLVYNLFDLGNCCHMDIDYDNGKMRLPRQEIYNNGLGNEYGEVYYNYANTGTLENESIKWSRTRVYNDSNVFMQRYFENNELTLIDGELPYSETPQPIFEEPFVTDTAVVFSASVSLPQGVYPEVYLWIYDSETDGYYQVDNPVALPRLNESYWVYLVAQAYNPNTFVYSEETWFEYEVPGLETSIIRGDVNGDTLVDISDVTALIDHILSGDFDDSDTFNSEAADCIWDGSINISDVTTLIDYLLSGHWSD